MLMDGVRRRLWLAVVALLGLVGSLLSVGVFPAAGVEGEADNEAVFSACVGPALESQGLTDVEGSFVEDAVNCLAYYGVTRGRTETLFVPEDAVSRWQMALFLARAAGPAGVVLPAAPADVFTDIGGVFEAGRTSINQMAALEIMPGISGTTFDPDRAVSRAQMAQILDAFLVAAEKGSGLGLGALGPDTDELADVSPDDSFDDINNVRRGEYSAIRRMFELGVARGTSDDNFSPGALVTRAQMAVFITRMLAHTVARPAGISIQVSEASVYENDSVDMAVAVRDTDLLPMPDAVVDVFYSSNPDDAFGEDGRCSNDDVSNWGGSLITCEIDFSDEAGDRELSSPNDLSAGSTTFWAWTGELGDRYDADETVSSMIELAVTKSPAKVRVTDDMAENATAAKFGDEVTFTLQVVDEDGNAVSEKDVKVTISATTVTNESGSTGALPGGGSTNSYATDASGKIELSYRLNDPRATGSDHRGDVAHLDLDITVPASEGLELEDKTTLEMAGFEAGAAVRNQPPVADAAVVWKDEVATASVLTLTQDVEYNKADKGGVTHMVRATLTDQYGDPVRNRVVEFASDDAAGVGAKPVATDDAPIALMFYNAGLFTRTAEPMEIKDVYPHRGLAGSALERRTKKTNRLGVAGLTYTRESDATGIETIVARVKADLAVPLAQIRETGSLHEDKWDSRSGDILSERIYHYWAEEPQEGAVQGRMVVNDAENNRMVLVGDSIVSLIKYDDNDHLNNASTPVLVDEFEKYVKGNAAHILVADYQTDSKKVSQFTAYMEWARLFPFDADEETADNLLQWFGASFAADKEVIVVGAPRHPYGDDMNVGRVYVYDSAADTDPAILEMPMADRTADTYFGSLVDISGDTIVVSTREDKQAAYVFVKPETGGWAASEAIKFDESKPRYGQQVAVDGDTLVIAYSAGAGDDAGGVFVYERDETTGWERSAPPDEHVIIVRNIAISAVGADPTPESHCLNNRCLALDEDAGTIVVAYPSAAPTWLDPAPAAGFTGYVDVISKNGPEWTSATPVQIRLNAPEATRAMAGTRWGQSVAVSGDTIIVSHEDLPESGSSGTGSVYVYTKSADAAWAADTPVAATLSLPAGQGFGAFADLSGDGKTIAVSQHQAQQGDWLGAVHVYTKPEAGWSSSARLEGENFTRPAEQYVGPTTNARFGWGTAIDNTSGAIWAALRQSSTGSTCEPESVTVGTSTVSVPVNCLRYSPVYKIDRWIDR